MCALQVHVAIGDADTTLAVYNALRGYLPELAALTANAPFYAGRDTGFASVRPLIGTMLPRQGVPPQIPSWAEYAEMLRWTGDPKSWWFELRPHLSFGTLELRVCDTQTTIGEAAAVAAYVHALVAWLREREDLGSPQSWRIAENRWRRRAPRARRRARRPRHGRAPPGPRDAARARRGAGTGGGTARLRGGARRPWSR